MKLNLSKRVGLSEEYLYLIINTMSDITPTSVLIGIIALGGLAFAAYYMKNRKNKKENKEETSTIPPVVDAKPAPTEQQKLAMAAGMMMPQQGLVQTPVGFVMN